MEPNNNQTKKSLKFSFLDGVFAFAMVGFTQEYFAPFALILGATARHIGALSALPNLFASLVQLKSADITESFKSRKKMFKIFVLLQALMILPMAIMALSGKALPGIFILIVVLFAATGAFALSPWASLMSDLVPDDKRGEYFGWRNKMLGFVAIISTFIAGLILQLMKKFNVFSGFVIIFSFAFLFRTISWYFLIRMHDPELKYHKDSYFTFIDFLSRIKESNFARFVLFVAMMSFSVNVGSPFFAVLMLKDLNFSYIVYTIVTISATLMIYLMMGRWGRIADKFGNLRVLKFTAPLIGVIPLLWIFNRHPAYLIFAQIVSGFAWAGFNLCASNFIYDAVTPEKRTRCISYFNVLNGAALCIGALLGGFLVQKLPPIFGYKILSLFVISSILRITVGVFMPMKLKEVRSVEKVSSHRLLFGALGIKPLIE